MHPYSVTWEGHYLNIDKELLWAGGWDTSIVERPKLMIRQTGDSLIVGLDREKLYHLNNVHSLSPLDENVSLEFLCALLNSRLMNRFYHLISLEKGRAMAQTDIETLETLPVRLPAKSSLVDIEHSAQRLVRGEDNASRQKIEQILVITYGLDDELVAYLQQDEL